MPQTSEAKPTYYQCHQEERLAYQNAYDQSHKEERAAYDAVHYEEHRVSILVGQAAYRVANEDALREKAAKEFAEFTEWLQILRTVNGCEDCGTHESQLEHHHLDPSTKRYNVSQMCRRSLDALEEELEKCVVLCHSCHKKRHVVMKQIEEEGSIH